MYGYGYSYPNNPQGSGLIGSYESGVISDGGFFAFPIDTGLASRLESLGLLNASSLVNSCNAGKADVLYNLIPTPVQALDRFSVVRASNKRVTGSSGSSVTYANNVPAFQFNDNGTYRGTSVEPGSTNHLTNNQLTGATVGVIGSGGALPTNWNVLANRGIPTEVVAIGTENGYDYIDIKYNGTATSTGGLFLQIASLTAITASQGQTWTKSAFFKVIDATQLPNTPTTSVQILEATAAGAFLVDSSTTIVGTSTLTRFSHTRTLTDATTARVTSRISFGIINNGSSCNFTYRIAVPQLEQQPIATSVISTPSGSTASRAKDDITLTGASSLIGQTQGAICAGFQATNAGTSRIIYTVFEDASNFIRLRLTTTNTLIAEVTQGGTPQASIESSALTTNTRYGAVLSYANNSVFLSLDGAQVGSTDTSATIPTCSKSNIGSDDAGANQLNGTIASAVNFATALSLSQANDLSLQLKNL
jgi:hypothetical protein